MTYLCRNGSNFAFWFWSRRLLSVLNGHALLPEFVFTDAYALHSEVFTVVLSVPPSHAGSVSKRLNLSQNFSDYLVAPSFSFIDCLRQYPIPREPFQRER